MHIYPDYYNDFKCIASRCRHNCCIGWEIDIDDSTLEVYKNVKGEFGQRLSDNIELSDTPHFVLKSDERCPFLNDRNLCDIICDLGENYLCDICREHPRFHNELPDRVESGLGMCCEEVARIILSKSDKTVLVCECDTKTDDEIILLRDKVIDALQDRRYSIATRIDNMLTLCDTTLDNISIERACEILLHLERMDEIWSEYITALKDGYKRADLTSFDDYMSEREYEYEQLCVYFIYRHFANSPSLDDAKQRAKFTAFAYNTIRALGAVMFQKNGEFDFETQAQLCRLFSSEIEYSDENIYTLFDIL